VNVAVLWEPPGGRRTTRVLASPAPARSVPDVAKMILTSCASNPDSDRKDKISMNAGLCPIYARTGNASIPWDRIGVFVTGDLNRTPQPEIPGVIYI
jgi:hypothetical protein